MFTKEWLYANPIERFEYRKSTPTCQVRLGKVGYLDLTHHDPFSNDAAIFWGKIFACADRDVAVLNLENVALPR